MIEKKKEYIILPLVILGCIQPFVSTEILSVAGYICIIWIIFKNNLKVKVGNKISVKILFAMFALGALVGISNLGTRAYIRDIYYFLNPIVFILIGLNASSGESGYKRVLNSIVMISVVISLVSLIQMVVGIISTGQIKNLRTYFDYAIWGDVISVGAVLALWKEETWFEKRKNVTLGLLVLVSILGLSRTIWIELIAMIVVVTILGQNKAKGFIKILAFAGAIVIVISVVIHYLPSTQLDTMMKKIVNSVSEISLSDNWTQISSIQANWRGYEMYCARKQFAEESILAQLFGRGFGTGIKVGSVSSLVGQSGDYIYVIHNGFYGMLIKEGIVGLVLYIFFYVSLLFNGYKMTLKSRSKLDSVIVGTTACLIIYTYLVKGIISDFVQINALLAIGGWIGYRKEA